MRVACTLLAAAGALQWLAGKVRANSYARAEAEDSASAAAAADAVRLLERRIEAARDLAAGGEDAGDDPLAADTEAVGLRNRWRIALQRQAAAEAEAEFVQQQLSPKQLIAAAATQAAQQPRLMDLTPGAPAAEADVAEDDEFEHVDRAPSPPTSPVTQGSNARGARAAAGVLGILGEAYQRTAEAVQTDFGIGPDRATDIAVKIVNHVHGLAVQAYLQNEQEKRRLHEHMDQLEIAREKLQQKMQESLDRERQRAAKLVEKRAARAEARQREARRADFLLFWQSLLFLTLLLCQHSLRALCAAPVRAAAGALAVSGFYPLRLFGGVLELLGRAVEVALLALVGCASTVLVSRLGALLSPATGAVVLPVVIGLHFALPGPLFAAWCVHAVLLGVVVLGTNLEAVAPLAASAAARRCLWLLRYALLLALCMLTHVGHLTAAVHRLLA